MRPQGLELANWPGHGAFAFFSGAAGEKGQVAFALQEPTWLITTSNVVRTLLQL
jgi:hypothetical protein